MRAQARQVYCFGVFHLDVGRRVLMRDGEIVALTPKLYETLLVFVQSNGQVVSKDDLMSRVWPDTIVEERSLSQNIFLLRKALGDDPRGCHYIETVPKVGYRFLPDIVDSSSQCGGLVVEKHDRLRIVSTREETVAVDGLDEVPAEPSAEPKEYKVGGVAIAPPRSASQSKYPVRAAFGLLALLGTMSAYLWISNKAGHSAPPTVRSIAVLPFRPLEADSGEEYLGLGMADTLITRLSGLGRFAVRPTSAVRRYQGSEQDAVAAGREQKVDAVLEGSIQRSGERIRITVRLLSVPEGAPIWSYKCDEKYGDIFAMQDSISERLAEAMTLDLTGEERRLLTKHYTENTESYQLYLKGRFFWNKRTADGFKKALEYFNQAVDRDPSYALADAGIADCYLLLADYDWLPAAETASKARAAATRAVQIDDTLAEAHTSLADISKFYDWDWAGAEREYRRAIELNPNYVTAHQWYAEFLSGAGRYDEAVREINRAEELDPLSLVVKSAAGWVLFFAHDYDRSIEQCQKVIEMDPDFGEVYSQLRRDYEQKGMYTEALGADERLRALRRKRSGLSAETSSTGPISGREAYWRKMVDLTKADLTDDRKAAEFRMAEAYAQTGEHDRSLILLEKAFQEHSFWMVYLRVHPHLDPLRQEPRFQELMRRVGLPA